MTHNFNTEMIVCPYECNCSRSTLYFIFNQMKNNIVMWNLMCNTSISFKILTTATASEVSTSCGDNVV